MIAEIKELACSLPATTGVPLSRWSTSELAEELVTRELVASISPSTVWRVLAGDAIRPWFHQSWIFPRDPNFAVKAAVVLDLYARTFDGVAFGADKYVICADEKTSIQCRCRCHPTLPPGKARLMRVEHEYERGGALAYLAAYDPHRAQVSGRCEPSTGIVPIGRLFTQVMTTERTRQRSGCSGSSTTDPVTAAKQRSVACRRHGRTGDFQISQSTRHG